MEGDTVQVTPPVVTAGNPPEWKGGGDEESEDRHSPGGREDRDEGREEEKECDPIPQPEKKECDPIPQQEKKECDLFPQPGEEVEVEETGNEKEKLLSPGEGQEGELEGGEGEKEGNVCLPAQEEEKGERGGGEGEEREGGREGDVDEGGEKVEDLNHSGGDEGTESGQGETEVHSPEVHSQEVHSPEVHPPEVHSPEVHPPEVHSPEVDGHPTEEEGRAEGGNDVIVYFPDEEGAEVEIEAEQGGSPPRGGEGDVEEMSLHLPGQLEDGEEVVVHPGGGEVFETCEIGVVEEEVVYDQPDLMDVAAEVSVPGGGGSGRPTSHPTPDYPDAVLYGGGGVDTVTDNDGRSGGITQVLGSEGGADFTHHVADEVVLCADGQTEQQRAAPPATPVRPEPEVADDRGSRRHPRRVHPTTVSPESSPDPDRLVVSEDGSGALRMSQEELILSQISSGHVTFPGGQEGDPAPVIVIVDDTFDINDEQEVAKLTQLVTNPDAIMPPDDPSSLGQTKLDQGQLELVKTLTDREAETAAAGMLRQNGQRPLAGRGQNGKPTFELDDKTVRQMVSGHSLYFISML